MISLKDFLEQDVIKFLDSKMSFSRKIKTVVRSDDTFLFDEEDYESEVEQALNEDNLTKAVLILTKVKSIYGKLARKSPKRSKLDLIIKNIVAKIDVYKKQNNVKYTPEEEEEKSFKESMKSVMHDNRNSTTNILGQQPNIIIQNSQPVGNNSMFLPTLNAPLNFDKLKEKQEFEKQLLNFKQALERESEKVYLEMQKKQNDEQKKHFNELKDEVLLNSKKFLENLAKTLSDKLQSNLQENLKYQKRMLNSSRYYLDESNQPTTVKNFNLIETDIKPINSIPKINEDIIIKPDETIIEKPESEIKENNDLYILQIIDSLMIELRNLIKLKKYDDAKEIYEKIKEQSKNIEYAITQKKQILLILKNTSDLLNKVSLQKVTEETNKQLLKEDKLFNETSQKINLDIKDYVPKDDKLYYDAVCAIKSKNKLTALKILVDLAKKNPLDASIKIRLKEALEL